MAVHGPRKQALTEEQARVGKLLLFQGKAQAHVAAVLGISQASISRLKAGTLCPEVPWPNGAKGPMPVEDQRHSTRMLWSSTADAYQKMPEVLQVRIFEAVNLQRAAVGLPEIPEMAPSYAEYLKSTDDDFDSYFERPPIEVAQMEEDKRICILMEEWGKLIDLDIAAQRENATLEILQSTAGPQDDEPPPRQERKLLYNKMSWPHVVEVASHLEIVKRAIATQDVALQEACCIAFYELRHSNVKNWTSQALTRQIWKIRHRISDDEELMQRICTSEADVV